MTQSINKYTIKYLLGLLFCLHSHQLKRDVSQPVTNKQQLVLLWLVCSTNQRTLVSLKVPLVLWEKLLSLRTSSKNYDRSEFSECGYNKMGALKRILWVGVNTITASVCLSCVCFRAQSTNWWVLCCLWLKKSLCGRSLICSTNSSRYTLVTHHHFVLETDGRSHSSIILSARWSRRRFGTREKTSRWSRRCWGLWTDSWPNTKTSPSQSNRQSCLCFFISWRINKTAQFRTVNSIFIKTEWNPLLHTVFIFLNVSNKLNLKAQTYTRRISF